jgi:hypothetical protein
MQSMEGTPCDVPVPRKVIFIDAWSRGAGDLPLETPLQKILRALPVSHQLALGHDEKMQVLLDGGAGNINHQIHLDG